jgi:hypothetical protein
VPDYALCIDWSLKIVEVIFVYLLKPVPFNALCVAIIGFGDRN